MFKLQRKYTVFISSTYEDLKEERKQATLEVLKLGHIPVGMEMFVAGRPSVEIIEEAIERCDIYLLIAGEKYGSIYEKGESYTQHEYEYAKGLKKLTFSLVSNSAAALSNREEKQKKFVEVLMKEQCAFFSDEGELLKVISEQLPKIVSDNMKQLSGYVEYKNLKDISAMFYLSFQYDRKIYAQIHDILGVFLENPIGAQKLILSTNVCEVAYDYLKEKQLVNEFLQRDIFLQMILSQYFNEAVVHLTALVAFQKNLKSISEESEYYTRRFTDLNTAKTEFMNESANKMLGALADFKAAYQEYSYKTSVISRGENEYV